MVLGADWGQQGSLISDFQDYGQMMAAPGVSFVLTVGWAFHQNTPLWVSRLGFQEQGGAQALSTLLKAWGSSHLRPIGQAVSETRFQERGPRAPSLVERGVKELGGHFKIWKH